MESIIVYAYIDTSIFLTIKYLYKDIYRYTFFLLNTLSKRLFFVAFLLAMLMLILSYRSFGFIFFIKITFLVTQRTVNILKVFCKFTRHELCAIFGLNKVTKNDLYNYNILYDKCVIILFIYNSR